MYKNQLQELAQRSCFNLPSYMCIREGPDHAPRFKATVNFNGEIFESPNYCTTLRQAEHSAAEMALNALASRGPSNSLAARILDETGVYKNLLQEVSQRVGASLPMYTTYRSGLGHLPVFSCTVELAGVRFTGEPAKNKKQAEKNAAMAAWSSLKLLSQQMDNSTSEKMNNDEQEHVTVARALQKYLIKAKMSNVPFPIQFPTQKPRPSSTQPPPATTSKILPLICPKTAIRNRPVMAANNNSIFLKTLTQNRQDSTAADDMVTCPKITVNDSSSPSAESLRARPQKFPAAGAAPYIPVRHYRPHHGIAPPVTIRNAVPVFAAPPSLPPHIRRPPSVGIAPPVCIRQAVPVYAAPPVPAKEPPVPKALPCQLEEQPTSKAATLLVVEPTLSKTMPLQAEQPPVSKAPPINVDEQLLLKAPAIGVEGPQDSEALIAPIASLSSQSEETVSQSQDSQDDSAVVEDLNELKI